MAQSESRYINILTDYGFKRVFGDEEVMRAFLTDLLQPKSPISKITFLDKELDGLSQYERGVVYDLFCTMESGDEFIVEMQNRSQPSFRRPHPLLHLPLLLQSGRERGQGVGLQPETRLLHLFPQLPPERVYSLQAAHSAAQGGGDEGSLLRQTEGLHSRTPRLPQYARGGLQDTDRLLVVQHCKS